MSVCLNIPNFDFVYIDFMIFKYEFCMLASDSFMFSLWCIDWVGSLYANQIFMYFCIKSSIGISVKLASYKML